jgi:pilus assembly protein CpaE
MMNQKISVKIEVESENLSKELEQIILAVGGFRLHNEQGKDRPDLLIYELGENIDNEFKTLHSMLVANEVGELFVTSENKDTDLLLKAMRAGAKEFISQPLDEGEVKNALVFFKKRVEQTSAVKEPVHAGQIVNVIGAKGGVGTTTVAVNLAMILSEKRRPVLSPWLT